MNLALGLEIGLRPAVAFLYWEGLADLNTARQMASAGSGRRFGFNKFAGLVLKWQFDATSSPQRPVVTVFAHRFGWL